MACDARLAHIASSSVDDGRIIIRGNDLGERFFFTPCERFFGATGFLLVVTLVLDEGAEDDEDDDCGDDEEEDDDFTDATLGRLFIAQAVPVFFRTSAIRLFTPGALICVSNNERHFVSASDKFAR